MTGEKIITVFGSSTPSAGDPAFGQAEELGRLLAESGFAVANGGYIGTMEAVSKGAATAGGRVIGVTCDRIEGWRSVRPNKWIKEEIRSSTLRERAYRLIEIGDALVALPGGIGTLAEVALSWSWLQTAEISPRPLILIGEPWRQTIKTFLDYSGEYVAVRNRALIHLVPNEKAALFCIKELLNE
jgi:uncharacterized protein (TIGR00730 family)